MAHLKPLLQMHLHWRSWLGWSSSYSGLPVQLPETGTWEIAVDDSSTGLLITHMGDA